MNSLEGYNYVNIGFSGRIISAGLYSSEYIKNKTKLMYGFPAPETFRYENRKPVFSAYDISDYIERCGFYNNDYCFIVTYSMLKDIMQILKDIDSSMTTYNNYENFMKFLNAASTCDESDRLVHEYNNTLKL